MSARVGCNSSAKTSRGASAASFLSALPLLPLSPLFKTDGRTSSLSSPLPNDPPVSADAGGRTVIVSFRREREKGRDSQFAQGKENSLSLHPLLSPFSLGVKC